MSFSELATMIPKAGSMNEYVRAGMGPFFATVCVAVGYIAIQLFPGSAEGLFLGIVINGFLGGGLTVKAWVWICVGFLVLLNLAGIRPFAAVEIFLTFAVAISLLIMGIVGLAGGGSGEPIGGVPDIPFSWSLLSALLGLAVFTFVGVEYTCPLAEELRRPNRDIPWGIFIGLTLVSIPLVLYGLAATRYIPADQLGDPTQITSMNIGIAIFGEAGKWWMGLVMIGASLGTLNAVLAGVPRILYGMSLTRQLPRPFGYLLPGDACSGGRDHRHGAHRRPHEPVRRDDEHHVHRAHPRRRPRLGDRLLPDQRLAREPADPRAERDPAVPHAAVPDPADRWRPACWRWRRSRSSPTRPRATTSTATSASSWQPPSPSRSSTTSSRSAACRRSSRPVPLREVYRETDVISADLPPEVEPGGPHLHRDDT